MKDLFKTNSLNSRASIGILIFRVVVGLAFMFHGWSKIQNPTGWMGPDGPPGFLQFLAAISEFGGGLSWILGLLTPLSCFGIFCTMGFATYFHAIVRGDPFVGSNGAFEPALVYFVTTIMLFLVGPGKFSLDQKIFGTKN
jgi:putative oxidoreductase